QRALREAGKDVHALPRVDDRAAPMDRQRERAEGLNRVAVLVDDGQRQERRRALGNHLRPDGPDRGVGHRPYSAAVAERLTWTFSVSPISTARGAVKSPAP